MVKLSLLVTGIFYRSRWKRGNKNKERMIAYANYLGSAVAQWHIQVKVSGVAYRLERLSSNYKMEFTSTEVKIDQN